MVPKHATSLQSYGQTQFKLMKSRYNLDLWPLRSLHTSVMRVIVLHPQTRFEVCRPSHSKDMAHFQSQR